MLVFHFIRTLLKVCFGKGLGLFRRRFAGAVLFALILEQGMAVALALIAVEVGLVEVLVVGLELVELGLLV